GITFLRDGGLWKANFGGTTFGFQYLPSELENVSIQGYFGLEQYSNKPLYIVNPNDAIGEILNNLNPYLLRYQEACLEGTPCGGDIPIKNCEENLIIFLEGDETKVYQDRNCVYLEGDSVMGADAFLYKMLIK
ncbi:MAG: hypothetical protein NUV97_00335, partial [archaeon]|nr:hypothetical protein [archaeon]